MTGKRFYLLVVFLVPLWLGAQTSLPQEAIGKPNIFEEDRTNKNIKNALKSGDYYYLEKFWLVYSDRNNNQTYKTSDGKRKYKEIKLGDRLTVADEKNGYLLLYKEKYNQDPLEISNQAMNYGWVPKENLLLKSTSSKDDAGFTRKSMVLTEVEENKKLFSSNEYEETISRFYDAPDLKNATGKIAKTFEIYFVLKEIGDRYLLSRTDILSHNESEAKSAILGWVDGSELTLWNQRQCIEPNWKVDQVKKLNRQGIHQAKIFSSRKEALNYKKKGTAENFIKSFPLPLPEEKTVKSDRLGGYHMRYPVIKSYDNGTLKIGTIGKISNDADKLSIPKIKERIQSIINKQEKANVLFVIDGTNSIGPYYNSVAHAVDDAVSQLTERATTNQFRFGAVIYRDLPHGDKITEVKRLTGQHQNLMSFLNGIETDWSIGKDKPEALFYGMQEGLQKAGFKKDESNFVIVIGDAGSHKRKDKSFVEKGDIIEQLSQYQSNIVFFQVFSGSETTYFDFKKDARDIILNVAKNIARQGESDKARDKILENISLEKKDNERYILHKMKGINRSFILASILFPPDNQQLSPQRLKNEVENIIIDYDDRLNILRARLENMLNKSGEFNPAIVNVLERNGVDENTIEKLKLTQTQFKIKGYTTEKIMNSKHNIFNYVVFMSKDELMRTVIRLESLVTDQTSTINQRKRNFQKALTELIRSQTGSSRESIMRRSVNEVYELSLGIPCQTESMKNIPLKHITNNNILSNKEFEDYMTKFKEQLKNLRDLSRGDADIQFESNNITYLWIPLEMFP